MSWLRAHWRQRERVTVPPGPVWFGPSRRRARRHKATSGNSAKRVTFSRLRPVQWDTFSPLSFDTTGHFLFSSASTKRGTVSLASSRHVNPRIPMRLVDGRISRIVAPDRRGSQRHAEHRIGTDSYACYVSLCVFMLRCVPLHIRVSPETRQRLQRLRTQRHLNLGDWLRVLTDEALEEQKTTDGQRPREGKAGACSQADISDR